MALPLKRFLPVGECPAAWKGLDLYLFRDATTVFYVGQSELAFARVWEHLLGGFHGHSIMGRFIWVNWPASMHFTVELLSSQSQAFSSAGNDRNAAERTLIQLFRPCFNASLNSQPTAVPASYRPANAKLPLYVRSLTRLIHEAERAVHAEETRNWVNDLHETDRE